MNLTDLREELHSRTDGLDAEPSAVALAVAQRIRATRRRRAAGAAGGLAVAALVGSLVLTNHPEQSVTPVPAGSSSTVPTGADEMPSRVVPDAPGDVVKDGLRIRARVADSILVAGVIGDAGQRSVSARWTPTTTHISYNAECWLPPGTDRRVVEDTMVRVSLSGTEGYTASSCLTEPLAERDLPAESIVPGEPGAGHPELKVGAEATLTVELVTRDGERTAVPGARLAGSVYNLGPRRMVVAGESGQIVGALPETVEHQGFDYSLATLASAPAGAGSLPTVATPAGVPFLVTYGSTAAGDADAGALYVTGLSAEVSRVSGGWDTTPQPARATGQVELRSEGPLPRDGVAFVAVYTLDR